MANNSAPKTICTIVGAGPGVGLAVAKRFGREGFTVVFISRRTEARKAYPTILRDQGFPAYSLCADPADWTILKQAFAQIRAKLGPTDVLIYNALVLGPRPVPTRYSAETLVQDLRIDIASPLVCVQQVVPDMRARKRGTIFFTAGAQGTQSKAFNAGIGIGRAGVRSLCYSLGFELKPYGIHVATVTIQSELVDPEFVADIYWDLYKEEPAKRRTEVTVGGALDDKRYMLNNLTPSTPKT